MNYGKAVAIFSQKKKPQIKKKYILRCVKSYLHVIMHTEFSLKVI